MHSPDAKKIALVTGGGRGIGAAGALRLARDGWNVAINYVSNEAAAQQIAAQCRSAGVDALVVRANVADESEVESMFATVDARLGRLTALVNSAGMTVAPAQRVEDMSSARLQTVFSINVIGSFLCAREAVRRMSTAREQGNGGSIVNLSSVAARVGAPGEYVDYAASKGAIDTMTLGLSKEVAEEGIRVNAVRPGVIRTEFHATAGDAGRADRLAPIIPMKRPGEADEIANAIAWLCSDEASYTTGALLDVTGGR